MDLMKILKRNWSGNQYPNGVLSTPRFISEEMTGIPDICGTDEFISGTVFSSLTASCTPRYFNLRTENGIYQVVTPFWMLQSCVRDGDELILYGKVDHGRKTVLLITQKHFLKFKKEKE